MTQNKAPSPAPAIKPIFVNEQYPKVIREVACVKLRPTDEKAKERYRFVLLAKLPNT